MLGRPQAGRQFRLAGRRRRCRSATQPPTNIADDGTDTDPRHGLAGMGPEHQCRCWRSALRRCSRRCPRQSPGRSSVCRFVSSLITRTQLTDVGTVLGAAAIHIPLLTHDVQNLTRGPCEKGIGGTSAIVPAAGAGRLSLSLRPRVTIQPISHMVQPPTKTWKNCWVARCWPGTSGTHPSATTLTSWSKALPMRLFRATPSRAAI